MESEGTLTKWIALCFLKGNVTLPIFPLFSWLYRHLERKDAPEPDWLLHVFKLYEYFLNMASVNPL